VTYLDEDTRVTRGDRGELRVFVISWANFFWYLFSVVAFSSIDSVAENSVTRRSVLVFCQKNMIYCCSGKVHSHTEKASAEKTNFGVHYTPPQYKCFTMEAINLRE
jgi:hypothetical protein